MASKRIAPPIEIEDASQLSILAYQVRTRPSFDIRRFLERLKSERARKIARVIAGDEAAAGDEVTIRQAGYYLKWADETARTAQAASRRPGGRRRMS